MPASYELGFVRDISKSIKVAYKTRTKRMPEDEREIVVLLSLLAKLEEGSLPRIRVHQIDDQGINFVLLLDADDVLLVGL